MRGTHETEKRTLSALGAGTLAASGEARHIEITELLSVRERSLIQLVDNLVG